MFDPYDLDSRAIRRAFSRAASTYDEGAALQTEVRARLLERLNLIRDTPQSILDAGSGTGHGSRALKKKFPAAHVVALDFALPMLQSARQQQTLFRKFSRVCGNAIQIPLTKGAIDWCVSNLMLAWCEPVDAALAEIQRVLKPGGLFAFASLGPDTLRELRTAWSAVDGGAHVHRLLDMHDLGDALVRAGFAEPVLDVERIVVTYDEPTKLFRELKRTGLSTATQGRVRHLGSRQLLRTLATAYEPLRAAGKVPATFEIVYGHAWSTEKSTSHSLRDEVSIPVHSIGRRAPRG